MISDDVGNITRPRSCTIQEATMVSFYPSRANQEAKKMGAVRNVSRTSEKAFYHQDGDTHDVKYVCKGRDGWTPVVGKRRKCIQISLHACLDSKHLDILKATLLSSGSDGDSDSGSDCSLHISPGADVQYRYSVYGGKPGLKVISNSTSTWTPIVSRTRSRLKS